MEQPEDAAVQNRPAHRPTIYTPELGLEFCERLIGRSLRSVCSDADMPDKATICRWMPKHPEFRDQYRACADFRADIMFEETLDIADDGTNDSQVDDKGRLIVNYDVIQRSKLRVDARQWFLSRLIPKKYGAKTDTNLTITDPAAEARSKEIMHRLIARFDEVVAIRRAEARAAGLIVDVMPQQSTQRITTGHGNGAKKPNGNGGGK